MISEFNGHMVATFLFHPPFVILVTRAKIGVELFMDIRISPLAVARLKAILAQEEDGERLAVRVVPLTSGCGAPSFAIELTEVRPDYITVKKEGILFTCPPYEKEWMDGIHIDLNRENGKFSITHSRPPGGWGCNLGRSGE
jgi:Fe-S cluster assembly iron-binding protein IscA